MEPSALAKRIAQVVWDEWYMTEIGPDNDDEDRKALVMLIQAVLDGEQDDE